MKLKIESLLNKQIQEEKKANQVGKLSNLMQEMLAVGLKNAEKSKYGYRYTDAPDLKLITSYFFQLGGPKLYSRFTSMLPGIFPSISSSRETLSKYRDTPVEGEIRLEELSKHLTRKGYPKIVVAQEDATRIIHRAQYNPSNNQVVGFVPKISNNGLPEVSSFPATSASVIKSYFESNPICNYAYVVMVQPLVDKATPFVLCIFGTDNKFNAKDVARRWQWVKNEGKEKYGITFLANCSDGDTRLMKCMQQQMFLNGQSSKWPWFRGKHTTSSLCVQDPYHKGTKLRNRMLHRSIVLAMGYFLVSPSYLRDLIEDKMMKDQHNLCESDINGNDRMNFRAMEKMYQENIGELLLKRDPASIATVATYR